MPTLQEKVTAALDGASGDLSYDEFVATLDSRERHVLMDTLRDMEKRGLIRRALPKGEDGKRVLRIQRVS
jgi:DNA-binding HxlR family transcriptional regulator